MSALTPRSRRRAGWPLATALMLGSLLAGCSGADQAARPASTAAPSAAAARPGPAGPAGDPLTGRAKAPAGGLVALKIDNSPLARRYHRGLGRASLVYQELMEGGSTRYFAVFPAATTEEVGPIRSARETDLELIEQFGRIALGNSGANRGTLAAVRRAAKAGKVIDAGYEVLPRAYRQGERRRDARNFFTSPARLDRERPGGSRPKDVGLRFGSLPAGAGSPAPRASIRFSPISKVSVRYDAASRTYAVLQDGDRMRGFAPANVVVQQVRIKSTRYRDVLGNRTPYTVTVGTGRATVLRDGRQLTGTWLRPRPSSGTRYVDAQRRDLRLRPGATLVLLVPRGSRLQVG